jgi:hypothetical protein
MVRIYCAIYAQSWGPLPFLIFAPWAVRIIVSPARGSKVGKFMAIEISILGVCAKGCRVDVLHNILNGTGSPIRFSGIIPPIVIVFKYREAKAS